ncbi:hypothetical protein QMK33_08995 [Hymenobacter sp. H14-R3]|uniref:hypothetical protein n=1 Tax=Hymenobacter sp. H14-R3 TaxID=3046308 RepID=UPI0024B8ED6B|nr:hypothetical protein [Hymenobacter sp. H14-R3]MDJ0365289.1 hypothetical protein [Hymenobacter sp. H14-R3]
MSKMNVADLQSYFIVTIPDSDGVQQPHKTADTPEQVTIILNQAKRDKYHLHLMKVNLLVKTEVFRDKSRDFQWAENAEEWYKKNK